jgi:protein-disulfide isomerase
MKTLLDVFLLALCVEAAGFAAQTEVGTEGHPSMGPPDAPVTIVEFADFECARCATMAPVLRQVLGNYPEEVRLVFRQLPLGSVNPRARKASEAALCAFDQGRFWDYHDALFEDQASLDRRSLEERAVRIGLDAVEFSLCLDSGRKAGAVDSDIEAAIGAGAYTAPTLYINGEMLTGSWPYRDVADRIDSELYRILRREVVGSEAEP